MFRREAQPFEHDLEDDAEPYLEAVKKRKYVHQIARPAKSAAGGVVDLMSSDDDDEVQVVSSAGATEGPNVAKAARAALDKINMKVGAEVDRQRGNSQLSQTNSQSNPSNPPSSSTQFDEVDGKAADLMRRLLDSRRTLSQSTNRVDLVASKDNEEVYKPPTVLTAAERAVRAQEAMLRYDQQASSSSRASSTTNAQPEAKAEPMIKIVTRLNGNHDHPWRIRQDQAFGKVRAKFAEIYGLQVVQVKFKFDGDSISDDSTPTSLDLEDEDLIEVVIDKALYEKAVASHLSSQKKK
ncbi:hypothetical protein B484DRAFT_447639 [Ochromonadaceae sp. CCMP2298]|nr:hypothetical protein B484DRAFT_447639 [Ochromonadaceae sp. CCMP2298]